VSPKGLIFLRCLFFQLGQNKKDAVHVFYEEPARALARARGRFAYFFI
jgi:hypothetical protein